MSWPNFRGVIPGVALYRSASVDLIPWDVVEQHLKQYQITQVIDLRGASEQKENTLRLKETMSHYQNRPLLDEVGTFKNIVVPTDRDYVDYYKSILTSNRQAISETVAFTLKAIAHENILFFCHAGKDRTGLLAWLIQDSYKCSSQYMVDHYVATSAHLEPYYDAFAPHWQKRNITKEEYIPRLKPSAFILTQIMDFINHEYGNTQQYLGVKQ